MPERRPKVTITSEMAGLKWPPVLDIDYSSSIRAVISPFFCEMKKRPNMFHAQFKIDRDSKFQLKAKFVFGNKQINK